MKAVPSLGMSTQEYRSFLNPPADPPWAELDSGIREPVRCLASAGFRPWASCEGHDGGPAWIEVWPKGDPQAEAHRLMRHLRASGLEGATVSLYWHVNASHVAGPMLHVEWWTTMPAVATGSEEPMATAQADQP